jgi:hypothetical protein
MIRELPGNVLGERYGLKDKKPFGLTVRDLKANIGPEHLLRREVAGLERMPRKGRTR